MGIMNYRHWITLQADRHFRRMRSRNHDNSCATNREALLNGMTN
jgi:hypothetical protein